MNTRIRTTAVLAGAAITLTACGDSLDSLSEMRQAANDAGNMASAYAEMAGAAQQMAENAKAGITIEPVDFRELKSLLPETIVGLPRTEFSGEKSSVTGFALSKATAEYSEELDDGNGRILYTPTVRVTLTDLGGTPMAMMGLAAWTAVEIDKESDIGFERTTTYQDRPAFEKFSGLEASRNQWRGSIQTVVADRFLVDVQGYDMEMDRIRDALDEIDLGRLDDMKEAGVTRAE